MTDKNTSEFKEWENQHKKFEENNQWVCRKCNATYVWQRHGIFAYYECPICHKSVSRKLFFLKNKKDCDK